MYRPVDIEFWQDEFILELSSEQKLTYIFLLTNRRTTQCGIYNIGLTISQLELQFSEEKIKEHLKFFQEKGKLLYNHENKEIMLLNWYKYNNIHNHKNIRICINKELKRVKTTEFINTFYEICKGICREEPELLMEIFKDVEVTDEILERERETQKEIQREAKENKETKDAKEEAATGEIVRANQERKHKGGNKENDKENNKESHKENSEERNKNHKDKLQNKNVVYHCFKNNFHLPSPIELQKLNQWVDDMGEPLVLKALEEAVGVNKRNLNYVSGILNNWLSDGITTLKEADEAIKKYKGAKKTNIAHKEANSAARFYSKNLAAVDYEKE